MNKCFNLHDYTVRGDGVSDDTTALTRCFSDAGKSGGGLVMIPAGNYLLSGNVSVPLCSGLTIQAHGARFHLPECLGDRAAVTLFSGNNIRDFAWQGGHFEGHCFDPCRTDNTWEPNVNTRAIAIATTPGGLTANLRFRDITGHRLAGAVISVQGIVGDDVSEGQVDTFARAVSVQDCHLVDCGHFMWDYGLLWQMVVWPEDYTPAEVELAWRYFRQDLVRRPVRMQDGDDRVRFDSTRDPIAASRLAVDTETCCFFGDTLPGNLRRGRCYYIVDAGSDYIRVGDAPGAPAIRFEGSAGPETGLITNLSQAYMHLYRPTGSGTGKGAIDLVACRQTLQTGNRLSALGDTMHLQYSHDNVFANNQITGSRMGAFFIAEYCRNTTVTGNTIDGTNGSRVMSVERSNEDVTISGNTFRNGGRGSWINQPRRFILQGNVFVNNTTKGECDPRRGRRSWDNGDYERYPELYFTVHEPDGRYGPVVIRDNIFVTGPECKAAIECERNGHDILIDGNVFEGPARSVCVDPGCERVHIGVNPGMTLPACEDHALSRAATRMLEEGDHRPQTADRRPQTEDGRRKTEDHALSRAATWMLEVAAADKPWNGRLGGE